MTQISDALRSGAAAPVGSGVSPGYQRAELLAVEFGAVTTLTSTGICVLVTTTGASSGLSATGSLVTAGVATFDVPRTVSLTSTANNSGLGVTVNGTDAYGVVLSEKITGPNATTVNGAKAFKTVTSLTATGIVTALSAGSSDIYGLPVRIADKGKVVGMYMDGVSATSATIVAGFTTTGTSTATTADTRGTVAHNTASNGTRVFSALVIVGDPNTTTGLYGATQA
jgi:hypothetical protein